VKMMRSQGYNLFEGPARIHCFKQFAKLLFYINNGKADIQYLSNTPLNPLWAVMLPRFHD